MGSNKWTTNFSLEYSVRKNRTTISDVSLLSEIIPRNDQKSRVPFPGGILPYKGLMGTCGQPGYVFRDFCLKQGIEFIIFCLNQGIDLSIFVLNRINVLNRVSKIGILS